LFYWWLTNVQKLQTCNVVCVEKLFTFDREPQEHVKIANIVLEKQND
jgi:transcription termination factor Rho